METASIRLICFYDGDLINENKNAEYVGGKKKLSKVSKTIGFKEFKEKIQAMLGLQPDDSEFTIKCRVYLDKEIQIAIDVDDDESLSSILDQSESIMAYIINRQSSVINTHRREANSLRNVEKETIGGGGGVDPPNEMDPRGNCLQSMEQPLLPTSTDVGSSNFEPGVNYDTSNQTPLHEKIDLLEGQEFPDADAFRHALSDLAIRKNFEYKPVKTNKSRLTMKCKSPECKWRIVAGVKDCNLPAFKVIKICKQHSCPVRQRGRDHDQATIKWIAAKIQSDIKKNPDMTPSEIITTISKKFDIQITYNKAAKAKTKAMKEVASSPFKESLEVESLGVAPSPLKECRLSPLNEELLEIPEPEMSVEGLFKELEALDTSHRLASIKSGCKLGPDDSEWLPDEASIPFEESLEVAPSPLKECRWSHLNEEVLEIPEPETSVGELFKELEALDIQRSYNKAAKAKTKAMKEVTPSPLEECLEVAPGPITEILNVEEVGEETSEKREVAGGEPFIPPKMCAPSSSRRILGLIKVKSNLWEPGPPLEQPLPSTRELLKICATHPLLPLNLEPPFTLLSLLRPSPTEARKLQEIYGIEVEEF